MSARADVSTLPSGARIVGSADSLPAENQQEIQRILNTEARRIYFQNLPEPRTPGEPS